MPSPATKRGLNHIGGVIVCVVHYHIGGVSVFEIYYHSFASLLSCPCDKSGLDHIGGVLVCQYFTINTIFFSSFL